VLRGGIEFRKPALGENSHHILSTSPKMALMLSVPFKGCQLLYGVASAAPRLKVSPL